MKKGTRGAGYFNGPPLKRLHPWVNSACDILTGCMTVKGGFQSIVIKDADLLAVLRHLQLARSHTPSQHLPSEAGDLGRAVEEGFPILLITRGAYGRVMDAIPGPSRNNVQAEVWSLARNARIATPSLLITCVDVPSHVPVELISACFQEPLNAYQELAYYDDKWWIPVLQSASKFPEEKRKKSPWMPPKNQEKMFQRRSFTWRDPIQDRDIYEMRWKQVKHQPEPQQHEPSQEVMAKIELQVTPGQVADTVTTDAPSTNLGETQQNNEAESEKSPLASTLQDNDPASEKTALSSTLHAHFLAHEFDQGLQAARILRALYRDERDTEGEVNIFSLVAKQGRREDAVQIAMEALTYYRELQDANSELVIVKALASMHLDMGEQVLKEVKETQARFEAVGDKANEAQAAILCAPLHETEEEAVSVLRRARSLLLDLGDKEQEANVLHNICLKLRKDCSQDMIQMAEDLQNLGCELGDKKLQAWGLTHLASARLNQAQGSKKEAEQALREAENAVALFKDAGEWEGQGTAFQAIAQVHQINQNWDGTLQAAGQATALLQATGGPCLSEALLTSSSAHLSNGHVYSAMWDATKALRQADSTDLSVRAKKAFTQASNRMNKPVAMGMASDLGCD